MGPQGLMGWKGVVRRPGTEVGKCRRCSSSRASAAVCFKTPGLASGFGPRERNGTLQLLEGCNPRRHRQYLCSQWYHDLDAQAQSATRAVQVSRGVDNGAMLRVLMNFRTSSKRIHMHIAIAVGLQRISFIRPIRDEEGSDGRWKKDRTGDRASS
ncbi:unnamed protein product, partial [Pleuronectes platessa]